MMKTTTSQTQCSRAAPSGPHRSSSLTGYSTTSSSSSSTSTVSTSSVTTQYTTTTPPTTPLLPFYWDPANPQQPQHRQQQQLLLQQTEETPKICNHSKRRHSDASSSPSMQLDRTESTSSLDCQSLQRSLKRIRLSSSPGELRLLLDLRQLAQGHEWLKTAEDVWHWPRTRCRLEQSQVDPLQLCFYVPGVGKTTTRLWIQIPRMYPHRPPSITQIQHSSASSTLGTPAVSLPFVKIQTIHITTEAPIEAQDNNSDFGGGAGPLQSCLDATKTVLTAGPWTCILRLTDVLEFLYQKLGDDDPWSTAPAMPDARGFLVPNRFDLGYYKGNVNAMDLKE